ncbi:MAG: hypothetical protein FWF51_06430 [Chitinivibrionia bacterium]|nr:hypothetical protein [Chitinivibrionia bacterium]MCL1946773.1 hypothetical protein [Chitinivibrionia bacterium]
MKKILILIAIPICVFASLNFVLKDGETISGDLICENKGKLTLKSGGGTVSVFKKSIKQFGERDIVGEREFILGDSLILKDKNEIFFVITTQDAARVKLREILADGSEKLIGEKSGNFGDTLKFFVPDGRFYESIEHTRGETKYYMNGGSFEMKSKCDSFEKVEIELKGFPGREVPVLKVDERKFKKDGE